MNTIRFLGGIYVHVHGRRGLEMQMLLGTVDQLQLTSTQSTKAKPSQLRNTPS